jgi:quinol monooxygenase YgiN
LSVAALGATMASMIHVLATIDIVPGQRATFLAAFRANVPNVLAEDGCVEYGPAVDLATDIGAQIPLRENVVTVVEKWRDLAALRAHLTAPHMLTYRAQVKDLVKHVALQILEPA